MLAERSEKAKRRICANAGQEARQLLASGHLYLTDKVILQFARTSGAAAVGACHGPERRAAVSTKTTVLDTVSYGEIGSRIARARGWLSKAGPELEVELGR
jgi:hypothetical protein